MLVKGHHKDKQLLMMNSTINANEHSRDDIAIGHTCIHKNTCTFSKNYHKFSIIIILENGCNLTSMLFLSHNYAICMYMCRLFMHNVLFGLCICMHVCGHCMPTYTVWIHTQPTLSCIICTYFRKVNFLVKSHTGPLEKFSQV